MILFNNKPIVFGRFPNQEIYLAKSDIQNEKENIHNVVTLKYENDQDFFKLLLVKERIDSLGMACTLRITYFPYSRMDRDSDTYSFTLQTVAKLINAMKWDEVILYEPHSDVTPALLDRCKVISVVNWLVKKTIDYSTDKDYQLFYPDAGAQKRYSEIFKAPNALVGLKHRDFESGKITNYQIVGTRDKDTVVIVDDLCSKGGTFILAATKLREIEVKRIILVVAHCEKTIFDGSIFFTDLIDVVITTDSILDSNRGFSRLKISNLGWVTGNA